MKVQSIISFFALYLFSGLNAQAIQNQSAYQDLDNSGLAPTHIGTQPENSTTDSQKADNDSKQQSNPDSPSSSNGAQNFNKKSQKDQSKSPKDDKATGECRKIKASSGMNIRKVTQLLNKVRGKASPLKLNTALIKASALKSKNKDSSKKSNTKAQSKKSALLPSKECGYRGKSAIQYTTIAKDEDDLIKKFTAVKSYLKELKDPKYKSFGAAKVGTQWTISFGTD